MKKMKWLSATLLLFVGCTLALGKQAKPAEHQTIAQVLDRSVTGVEGEFVPAADAMPEDKYSFAPTNGEFKGVRTFAQQVKHVAAINYMVGAAILGEKPPVDTGGENGPDSVKSKRTSLSFSRTRLPTLIRRSIASMREISWARSRVRLATTWLRGWEWLL
jgi:hypothetical protein